MTITEYLVASAILMTMATQASQVFGDSMQAIGKSRLRDGINTSIQRDIEEIREIVSLWSVNTMGTDGQLSYDPPQSDCENSILATTLLSDQSSLLPASRVLDLSNISTPLQGLQITRTIEDPRVPHPASAAGVELGCSPVLPDPVWSCSGRSAETAGCTSAAGSGCGQRPWSGSFSGRVQ